MKKLLLLLVLTLSLTGCGSSDKPNEDSTTDTPDVEEKPANTDLIPKTNKVPGYDIYVNVPNYQEIEDGYTRRFVVHGQKMVTFTADKKSEGKVNGPKDAHDYAFKKMTQNLSNEYLNFLTPEKESVETINGIEVYRYEGTVNIGRDTIWEAYAVGYSFEFEGLACNINAMVMDKEQPEELKALMKDVADAMIYTVRNEE